jgi:hypothetical protein
MERVIIKLVDGDRLRKVARLVGVDATANGQFVRQQLEGHGGKQGSERTIGGNDHANMRAIRNGIRDVGNSDDNCNGSATG